ncbi:hypothetical protein RHMOL_Rhmol12G0103900 [Rhododendron molle]|uniref:Uncharacterized protein n=1 Tax=Rhododendron molle TaxID=49168 RepID=A0ACC0LGU1_RHOML|nr:hypothetical protein RHMOL_Rhmol12G0103900 [Rhododendron molle]
MAVHSGSFLPHPRILPAKSGFPSLHFCRNRWTSTTNLTSTGATSASISISGSRRNSAGGAWVRVSALDRSNSGSSNYVVPLDASSCITRPLAEILRDLNKRIPDNIIINNTNTTFIPWYGGTIIYNHFIFRSFGEFGDISVVDLIKFFLVNPDVISRYHANRMLSFYAPGALDVRSSKLMPDKMDFGYSFPCDGPGRGWCGEVRDVIFSDNGSVTVVYRVTIRGSDGEAHRESSGTVSSGSSLDPVAAAEEIAFCRACARFGLGLYLYHDE